MTYMARKCEEDHGELPPSASNKHEIFGDQRDIRTA